MLYYAVTALAFMGAGRSPPVLSGAVDGSVACVNYHERLHHTSSVFRQSGKQASKMEREADIIAML